jgi:hypothetical protein
MAMWEVIKPCVVQATGKRYKVGDVIEVESAFDISMLQVEQCIVPHIEHEYETQAVVPMERRKWGRKGKA